MNNILRHLRIQPRRCATSAAGAGLSRSVAAALIALAAFNPFAASQAGTFPERSIELIVPSSPGAPIDIVARAIAPSMAAALKQPVVVQNVAGAGGVIGATRLARAPKDGYTIGIASSNIVIAPSLYKLQYNAQSDIAAVTILAEGRMVLAANSAVPAKGVQDLLKLAAARSSERSLTYGSQGVGSIAHLEFELFRDATKASFLHVPYKGSDQMYAALSAGEIDVAFVAASAAMNLEKSGRIKVLGVMGDQRVSGLPGIPTMKEQGVKVMDTTSWIGMFAPSGVDAAVMDRIRNEAVRALNSPEVRKVLGAAGYQFVGNGRAQAQATYLSDLRRYQTLITEHNIKVSE
ncbi:tripartite tricarboxylate transporter substrate binding protein [Ramlibacter sp. G-1-2-2]|uniref:Tripartite tricarboxylate transporter substrate binding protein n=1 Tax=Ramlibacter agri TaxID=2728837 RepID=A0A848GYA4_9BURK|nr:tripartite tricarboxylate transporter substrate binding protein [Ramlibacter agri]